MVNITAGFVLAAYVMYVIARGDLGRLLWIIGAAPASVIPPVPTLVK